MRQIVILAGGLATRLHPITKDTPKSLLTISGESFISLQIENLVKLGIRKFHFCLGQYADQVKQHLAQSKFESLNLSISYDSSPRRGTAGALIDAAEYLESEFLLTYGDSYLPVNFENLEKAWTQFDTPLKLSAKSTMHSRHIPNIEIISNGTFKYGSDATNATHIDYGLMLANKSVLEYIEKKSLTSLTSVIERLSRREEAACALTESDLFEVGSFEGIKELEDYLGESK